jgi:hypothetical protein
MARTLLRQIPQAQTQIDRALALSPQDQIVRTSLSITAAKLKARGGGPAATKHAFDTDLAEATKMGLVRWHSKSDWRGKMRKL